MKTTRRHFGVTLGGAAAAILLGDGCASAASLPAGDGRLTARPRAGVVTSATGRQSLGLGSAPGVGPGRDAILQMPSKPGSGPLALFVFFHGAGGSGDNVLRRLGSSPDDAGLVVLSPDSRGSTWDAIRGGFGPDVAFINAALERVFSTVTVDPERISVGGFSDGASYAISLGLINGDLFRRVVAFSPGFVVDGQPHGTPAFLISHGTTDPILPIESCGRPIAAALRARHYDVTFREFPGVHEIPPDIGRDAMQWAARAPKA